VVTQSASDRGKSATAFRTIGEVSLELDLPQHVLRFWESKFTRLKPMKRGGGRRYYRPEDIDLLLRIKKLLYEDGYTIKGVQKLLREGGGRADDAAREAPQGPQQDRRPQDRPGGGPANVPPPSAGQQPGQQPGIAPAPGIGTKPVGIDDPTRKALNEVVRELEALAALLKKDT
jgi:DNA-binding transcriptional MerR regulator